MHYHAKRSGIIKSKTLILWILFFLILLIMAILLSWLIYIRAINIIEEDLEQSYRQELVRASYLIDDKLNEVRRVALEQSLNQNVQQFYQNNIITPDALMNLRKIQQGLKDYCISNSYINDIVIGSIDADKAISNKSIYSIKEVSNILLDKKLINRLQEKTYKNEFYILEKIQSNNESIPQIVYLLSLPLESGSKNHCFVMITMKTDLLFRLLPANDDRIFMLKFEDKITYLNDNQIIDKKEIEKHFDVYHLFTTDSNESSLKYGYYISKNEFILKFRDIKRVTIISLLLCVILFIGVLVVFLKINYNPIHRIFVKINQIYSNNIPNSNDELKYIEKSLSNIFSERQDLMGTLKKQNYALNDYFILKLIMGEINENLSLEEIKIHDDKFIYNRYIVITTKPINYHIKSQDCSETLYSLKIAQHLIKQTFLEFLEGPYIINSIDIDETIVTLINFENSMFSDLKKLLQLIISDLKNLYQINVMVSASHHVTYLKEINKAYIQTKEGIEYCLLKDVKYIQYDNSEIQTNINASHSQYIRKINNKISNCITVGNFAALIKIIDEIFETYFSDVRTISRIKLNMYELIHVLYSSLYEYTAQSYINISPDTIVSDLLECKSIKSLKQSLTHHLFELNKKHKENVNNQKYNIVNSIIEYIEDDYENYNLCVNYIALKFNLSVPYLSKLFKKVTSINLHDFISSVRIRHSKNILNKLSVNEVAIKVGFNDSSSFIKTFKKIEGITPGKYIKHLSKKSTDKLPPAST